MNRISEELLGLIQVQPIPAGLCDLRPKVDLLREGYAELSPRFIRQPWGDVDGGRMLAITQKGRDYLAKRVPIITSADFPDKIAAND